MQQYSKIDAAIAAFACALLPGAGQLFALRFVAAAFFFFASLFFYVRYPPVGFFLHGLSVIDALAYGIWKLYNQKCCKKDRNS